MPTPELTQVNVFWFRRDLRLEDNHGLSKALNSQLPVLPVFIFDSLILDELEDTADPRVNFIHQQLNSINAELIRIGSSLTVLYGKVLPSIEKLANLYQIKTVYCNHDYEPYANERDQLVSQWLKSQSIEFRSFKDQVIFEKKEILKKDAQPYTVFTPYMNQWKLKLRSDSNLINSFTTDLANFARIAAQPLMPLNRIGFKNCHSSFREPTIDLKQISTYHKNRNYPASNGTTRLSIHLRFGTISIRKLVAIALEHSESLLNELIWREFYMMILWNFPRVVKEAFKPAYNHIPWTNNEAHFERWCNGLTGYPLVDAGMRELNETGFMHNRLRMVTASFLTKHLLIHWQWGEAYFASKLTDFELSSNNGGWQWSAGCGCDAAPYFRVFNPTLQAKKFDPNSIYIRKWAPDSELPEYPQPMVDHREARARAIEVYRDTLNKYTAG